MPLTTTTTLQAGSFVQWAGARHQKLTEHNDTEYTIYMGRAAALVQYSSRHQFIQADSHSLLYAQHIYMQTTKRPMKLILLGPRRETHNLEKWELALYLDRRKILASQFSRATVVQGLYFHLREALPILYTNIWNGCMCVCVCIILHNTIKSTFAHAEL